MDITENGFLAATAIIGGIMSVALSSILNCAKRQSTGSRKGLIICYRDFLNLIIK